MTDKRQPESFKPLSADVAEKKRRLLKQLFPGAFSEKLDEKGAPAQALDFDKLKAELGEVVELDRERYSFTWNGKSEALTLLQQRTAATLKPQREQSVNFDETGNLFIEGDNLEVLKLLQKSYYGKVKMIYIDPPYNTGKEFVYPDDYKDNLKNYLELTGQADEEGKKLTANADTHGRYHTKWLNMMFPRLYLARNLLRDDGVIFISIDDHEVANLRKLCDEIFGEENFVSLFAWRKTDNQANIGKIARVKEYILAFAKDGVEVVINKMQLSDRAQKEYRYKDGKGHFRRSILLDKTRGRHIYTVKTPGGLSLDGPWMKTEDEFKEMDDEGKIYWTKSKQEQPYGKIYLHESKGQIANDFLGIEFGTNQQGSIEVEQLFQKRLFDFPKPSSLLKHCISIGTSAEGDIILDFFAGSCTTAHATMQLNAEDGGDRKFIMVQLPERTDEQSEAHKAGYATIADIGKERIRRAIKAIEKERAEKGPDMFAEETSPPDLGFRVFTLAQTNITPWREVTTAAAEEAIKERLELAVDHIAPDASDEDLLYEILLKDGFSITEPLKTREMAGKRVYEAMEGAVMICLEREMTPELIDAVVAAEPSRFYCLDSAFRGRDELKANAAYNFLRRNEVEESDAEITFRTI